MPISKCVAVIAFALLSSQAMAQPMSFDDNITGSIPDSLGVNGSTTAKRTVVVVGPTERTVNGVREVLVRNNWMIAPNN